MRRRTDIKVVMHVIELRDEKMLMSDIANIVGISPGTVSRILKQKDTYLSEDIAWDSDKAIGLRCDDCGVLFARPNGYRCVCDHCRRFRQLKGLDPKRVSNIPELEVDLSGLI